MTLTYRTFEGEQIADVLEDFARLRIKVFRDWPYLYDGDLNYELQYLAGYTRPGTVLVGAYAENRLVGAATGMPLLNHADDFAQAFADTDTDFRSTFYCAESVLLPTFRGQGAGRVFFQDREAFARRENYTYSTFCAVIRPDIHNARPPDYRPLDPFWRGLGYAPLPDVIARFSWRDIGDEAETKKPLQFWMKIL
ncbi:MAG: GNAT family N-acetyltransferase [Pseudomonadota bacterium]